MAIKCPSTQSSTHSRNCNFFIDTNSDNTRLGVHFDNNRRRFTI
jgi:hypothetical protein